jgi:hypothetical protein
MVEDIHATNNFAMKLNSTPGLTYTHILNEIVSPLRLSLIIKTQIRGLDAFDATHQGSSPGARTFSRRYDVHVDDEAPVVTSRISRSAGA